MKLPIGATLYTVRADMEKDYTGTIRKIAKMGYAGVEFFGYSPLPAEKLKDLLDETGLQAVSWHVDIRDFISDYKKWTQFHKMIGNKTITIPHWDLKTMEDVEALADIIHDMEPKLRADGFVLAYHNHDFEFQTIDGVYILDILKSKCPNLFLQLDTYWVHEGGEDPVSFYQKHQGHVRQLHLKDGYGGQDQTPVGSGAMDISALVHAAEQGNVEWLLVECDEPKPDGITVMEQSIHYLKTL